MATREQLERLYHRYHFASKYIADCDVLEVGCGSGIGLGYLSNFASKVVGGDIDRNNVKAAADYYSEYRDIEVLKLDAHSMPFDDECFDAILLFEAIYYLEKPEQFISEAYRVLKKGGHLILCTVNKCWRDFHPSKYSVRYYSVPELFTLLEAWFDEVQIYGAFEVKDVGTCAKLVSVIKRTASKMNLIPGSLEAREFLKRMFVGHLEPIPTKITDGMANYPEPGPVEDGFSTEEFKIVYAVARK